MMEYMEQEMTEILGPEFFKDSWTRMFAPMPIPDKPSDVKHHLELPLEKLYTGTNVQMKADKKIPCTACKSGQVKTLCPKCIGYKPPNNLPKCMMCSGYGFVQTVCSKCKGKGIIVEVKIHKIHITAGTHNGTKLRVKGAGDVIVSNPENASDIICTIKQKAHPVFRRHDADLYLCMKITLTEALCGFRKPLKHLDNRIIMICSGPGKVIRPGDMKCIKNEGMPKTVTTKGDLIIIFNVMFPSKLAESTDFRELENLLPSRQSRRPPDPELEDFDLVEFDPKEQVYSVPFRQHGIYSEPSPAKVKKDETKMPTCAQQ